MAPCHGAYWPSLVQAHHLSKSRLDVNMQPWAWSNEASHENGDTKMPSYFSRTSSSRTWGQRIMGTRREHYLGPCQTRMTSLDTSSLLQSWPGLLSWDWRWTTNDKNQIENAAIKMDDESTVPHSGVISLPPEDVKQCCFTWHSHQDMIFTSTVDRLRSTVPRHAMLKAHKDCCRGVISYCWRCIWSFLVTSQPELLNPQNAKNRHK